ncbi:MAG TPA: alanine--glyoxylate aminotransferase family protein [Acidobacteriota bacterium]|nr:alanine--glyoxylate aminotransferase family protein [Acidobacteriota bacterium]
MRKKRLFTPGPTPLIPEARLAMAGEAMHHRTPEFQALLHETRRMLQAIYKTESEIVILASSGTGAMEAAVSNLLAPGDAALAVVAGKFGERWAELCQSYQVDCSSLVKEYGEAASAEEIVAALEEISRPQALLIQGCETSTATSHDLEAIARAVRARFPDLLIIVDAITALGSQPLETDAWDLDVVISGSQKSFSVSPGLAFLSIGPRARRRLEESSGGSRYYFDLRKELKGQAKGSTAYTPAVSLIASLHAACRKITEQGVDEIVQEAQQMARAARAGLKALGFRILSQRPAGAVTAAFPPEGVDAEALRKSLEARFGVKVAGGQGHLKGRVIRIAHLGYFDLLDVCSVLSALELCLLQTGRSFALGSGVAAALEAASDRSAVGR